eukprot:SAG22_NODE_16625_length_321_cov_0.936937_1_plen_63_part_01
MGRAMTRAMPRSYGAAAGTAKLNPASPATANTTTPQSRRRQVAIFLVATVAAFACVDGSLRLT